MAQLIAHDPEDVLRLRHVSHIGDFDRSMLQYRSADCKRACSAKSAPRGRPRLGLPAALGLQRSEFNDVSMIVYSGPSSFHAASSFVCRGHCA